MSFLRDLQVVDEARKALQEKNSELSPASTDAAGWAVAILKRILSAD
jgi:hypothetical protein